MVNTRKPEKLRTVLDCAAKHRGRSLNGTLYQGSDTTANLVRILLRFQKGGIAASADVEGIFMQMRVSESDRVGLHLLWWPHEDLSTEIHEYQMTAHPSAARYSPFVQTALCSEMLNCSALAMMKQC